MLFFVFKYYQAFQSSFPLYIACKHSSFMKNEELTSSEKKQLIFYCDLSENEMSVFLLRKIIYFIEAEGWLLFINCFKEMTPTDVSILFIHSMISVIQIVRNYFNISAINHKLVQIRSHVINYLCNMQDSDLRIMNNRTMFEYIWSVVKEYSTFSSVSIDRDGLRISLKYFSSSTLTMRLSGIAQINNYITMYNDLQNNPSKPNVF